MIRNTFKGLSQTEVVAKYIPNIIKAYSGYVVLLAACVTCCAFSKLCDAFYEQFRDKVRLWVRVLACAGVGVQGYGYILTTCL